MDHNPTEITLRVKSRVLLVGFDDGALFEMPFEYLRVHSPSAEVKGHGPGQEVLQTGFLMSRHRLVAEMCGFLAHALTAR